MGKAKSGRWRIHNDLVHELLTYGDGSPTPLGLHANWSIGHGYPIVKGLFTWLVMRALKVERLPWMADWPYTFVPTDKRLESALSYFIHNRPIIDDACEEIQFIHQHTQEWFAGQEMSNIWLGRGYKNDESFGCVDRECGEYANTLLRQADAAAQLGIEVIDVPHDVITSWACSCRYTSCVAGVEMDIPVNDILCGADTLEPRESAIGINAMESGEWLVINRRWDGLMTLPVASIKALKGHRVKVVTPEEAESVLEMRIPTVRRSAQINSGYIRQPRAEQSLRSRAKRAWEILTTRYH